MRLMTLIGFILINLLSATEGWGASSYSYDALGNMRGYVIDDYRHARHLTLDYHYDARNRLINFVNERGGSFDQAYDNYGRITTGHNRLTQYDHSHRPTSVTHNGGRQYAFVFDGNLHRAKETIFHKTRYSVYGQGGTLLFRDNITDGETTDYVRLGGHTIARLKTDSAGVTTVIYPHTNHLGSPVAATDANGDLLWREEYTPFGRPHISETNTVGEEGFTGHIFDGQGMVHMKARTYMTTSYRFTTPDPVTFLSSGLDPAYFNRYAYVANDPINAIDPDGRSKKSVLKQGAKFLRTKADQRRIKNARARGRRAALKQERQQLRDTGRSDSELSPGRQEELLETGNLKNMDGHHNPSISSANNVDEAVEIAENPDAIRFMEKSDHQKLHSDAGGTQVPIGGGDVITGALTAAAVVLETIALIPDPVSVLTDDNRDNMGCGDFSGCGQNDEN